MVDLPDAVGHPAFPTTLEGLVSSSRGTVMDAARTALARDDVFDWKVTRPRILTPLFPASLLSPGSLDVERRLIGPEQDVPWPAGAAWLEYEPKVAAVLGAGDLGRRPVPQRPAPVRLHARERLAGARRERRPGEHGRGRADRDRAVHRDRRRDRSAGDVPAGAHRRRGDREGQPQRHRHEPVPRDRGGVRAGAARARGRARAEPVRRMRRRTSCGPGRRWNSAPRGSGRSATG